jgi:prophage regulatory protein
MSQKASIHIFRGVPFNDVDRIVRFKEFLNLTGLGRSTVYKLIHEGKLTRPLKIGARAVGWRASYVNSFLESRPFAGDQSC